jgi:hypothetical protein
LSLIAIIGPPSLRPRQALSPRDLIPTVETVRLKKVKTNKLKVKTNKLAPHNPVTGMAPRPS